MSRPKYFIKTEVMVYGGRTKYYVVKGFSDDDQIAKVGSERDATKLCEEFERLTDENARLKAEVERLKMEESKLLTLCETYEGDLERLRASSFVTAVPVEQYERVIKAGSEMSAEMRFAWLERIRTNKEQREAWLKKVHQCLIDWNAAKEGKPHA